MAETETRIVGRVNVADLQHELQDTITFLVRCAKGAVLADILHAMAMIQFTHPDAPAQWLWDELASQVGAMLENLRKQDAAGDTDRARMGGGYSRDEEESVAS